MAGDELAGTGETDALRALAESHGEAVRRYVVHLTGNTNNADDIVQETLLRAWRTPRILSQPTETTRSWLFTVARNLVISGRRRQSARVTEVPIEDREFPALTDDIDRVLQVWQVIDVLRGLSTDHRQVIVEMYYRRRFETRTKARFAVAKYIEIFNNRKRLHSSLGYRTPAEALTDYQARAAA